MFGADNDSGAFTFLAILIVFWILAIPFAVGTGAALLARLVGFRGWSVWAYVVAGEGAILLWLWLVVDGNLFDFIHVSDRLITALIRGLVFLLVASFVILAIPMTLWRERRYLKRLLFPSKADVP